MHSQYVRVCSPIFMKKKIGFFVEGVAQFSEKNYQFRKNINFEKELSIFRKKLSISKTWQFSGKNGPVSKKLPFFRKKCQYFCKITTVSTQNTNCSVNIFSMDLHGTKRHTVLDQLYAPPLFHGLFLFCVQNCWLWNKSVYERLHNRLFFILVLCFNWMSLHLWKWINFSISEASFQILGCCCQVLAVPTFVLPWLCVVSA